MPSLTQVFEAVVRKGNVLVPIYHSSVKHLYVLMRVIRNGLYEKENPLVSHYNSSSDTFAGSLFFIRQGVDNEVAFVSFFIFRESNVVFK